MEQSAFEFLQSVLREIAIRASMGCAYEKNWTPEFSRKEVMEAWTDEHSVMRKARNRKVTVAELAAMPLTELRQLGFAGWDENLTVIPIWAWNYVADGERLICITGVVSVKGVDSIDLDVRGGCIAYGFQTPLAVAT